MLKKAMILAAGFGTRLRPLTHHIPKPLMPVANLSIIEHHFKRLKKMGIQEVMLNLHHLPEVIKSTIGSGEQWGLKVHYSLETPEVLGTGGGLAKVKEFFQDEEAFLLLNGDILHEIDLEKAWAQHQKTQAAASLLLRTHPGDQSGWIGVDGDGWVKRVPEMDGSEGLEKFAFTGLHILTPHILPFLPKGESYCILRKGYRGMLEQGLKVSAIYTEAPGWNDIGTPKDYLEANLKVLTGTPLESAEGLNNKGEIVGAVLLGQDITIEEGAKVGPNVVLGDGCFIGKGTTVQDSVILPGTQVEGERAFSRAILFQQGEIILEE